MNFSDSFYFTVPADCADYNYFTDFVKTKAAEFLPLLRHPLPMFTTFSQTGFSLSSAICSVDRRGHVEHSTT